MKSLAKSISRRLPFSSNGHSSSNTPNKSASTSHAPNHSRIRSPAYPALTIPESLFAPSLTALSPVLSVSLSPFIATEEPLFDLDHLDIKEEDREWFTAVNLAVLRFLCNLNTAYNYQHVRRVVSNAAHILKHESKRYEWARKVDPLVVWVACMTRVVGDELSKREVKTRDPVDIIDEFLKPTGCPLPIRRQAAFLAVEVSVDPDVLEEESIKGFAEAYPAFRIIEDAHRLDELGAVGIIKYIFGLDKSRNRYHNLTVYDADVIELIFDVYPRGMKTETGKKMAEWRFKWMVEEFLGRWKAEVDTGNV